jgi:hypothetical protein|tara:strand:+ start:15 stop:506 length:492 start_codon:yes stop_codon:yes gene_type:complete
MTLNNPAMLRATVTGYQEELISAIDGGEIEDAMDQLTLKHHFAEYLEEYDAGVYAREMFIPKGVTLVGKIHKYSHLSFLLKGKVIVISEFTDRITIKAPYTFPSPAGSKRAFLALKDSILVNVHMTRTPYEECLPEIEKEVIVESYSELGMDEPNIKLFKKGQ